MEQERTVIRRRPPTPEEQEWFRDAYEKELAGNPEILADLERCWRRDCRVPLSQLGTAGVFRVSEAVAALKAAREARGVTVEAVAAAVGTSAQAIAAIEAGEDKTPLPRFLGRYAAALGMRFVTGLVPVE